jgi:hypothetical protein
MNTPPSFPTIAEKTGWALIAAGFLSGLCGIQLMALARLPNAIDFAPLLMLLLGIGTFFSGVFSFQAETRPLLTGLALSFLNFLLTAGMGLYLFFNLFFSILFVFTPLFNLLSASAAAFAYKPVSTYQQAMKALPPVELYPLGPPPTQTWIKVLGGWIIALIAATIATAVFAPLLFFRTSLQLELLATLRSPFSPFVESHQDYTYQSSLLKHYASYEAQYADLQVETVTSFADEIAEEVGWQLLTASGISTIEEAEIWLWENKKARQIPLWIASSLRDRGVFYHQESLLSRSFDTWLHSGDAEIHLDCDQLVYLFSHISWRLDLDFKAVPSPMHLYLRYGPPQGSKEEALFVETTNFRSIDIQGNRVDFLGVGIGKDFFIHENHHQYGDGYRASKAFAETAGLYQPMTDKDIEDSIVANVLVGLEDNGIKAPYQEELEKRLEGTRNYLVVSNLYRLLMRQTEDPAFLEQAALKARELRERFPMLIIDSEPAESVLLARLYQQDPSRQGPILLGISTWYQEHAYLGDPPTAVSRTHAEFLLLQAEASKDCSLYPVVARYLAKRGASLQSAFCESLARNPSCTSNFFKDPC